MDISEKKILGKIHNTCKDPEVGVGFMYLRESLKPEWLQEREKEVKESASG